MIIISGKTLLIFFKILNTSIVTSCYPKIDETHYLFDPRQEMSTDSENDLAEELKDQVICMNKLFVKNIILSLRFP
jgi:hypothetical protein